MSKKMVIIHRDKKIESVYRSSFPFDHIFFIHYSTFNENYFEILSNILEITPDTIVIDSLINSPSFSDFVDTIGRKTNALIIFHKNIPFLDY
jgi:hypothetical protein